nr:structural protein [Achromobacter phage vB_Ade_ART]
MASFDYSSLRDTAVRLIERFGAACSIVSYQDVPASNPADPPTRTKVTTGTVGVFLRYKSEDIDGTRVRAKDQMVLFHANPGDMPPEGEVEGDYEVVRGSELWKMISVSILKPGPVTMLYKVQVRI